MVVVPDFFYGVLVIDSKDPNFNANSWLKVHNMVSILLFSYNLQSLGLAYEKLCKNQESIWGPSAFDVQIDILPHVYSCFVLDLSLNRMIYHLFCMN